MNLAEKIAAVQELIAKRIEIDGQLELLLLGGKIKGPKKSYKKKVKDNTIKGDGRKNFTAEEKANIINLYNLKEPTRVIAKKFGRTSAAMSAYIWRLKSLGEIQPREKEVEA